MIAEFFQEHTPEMRNGFDQNKTHAILGSSFDGGSMFLASFFIAAQAVASVPVNPGLQCHFRSGQITFSQEELASGSLLSKSSVLPNGSTLEISVSGIGVIGISVVAADSTPIVDYAGNFIPSSPSLSLLVPGLSLQCKSL